MTIRWARNRPSRFEVVLLCISVSPIQCFVAHQRRKESAK
jgi:hypothetical protein